MPLHCRAARLAWRFSPLRPALGLALDLAFGKPDLEGYVSRTAPAGPPPTP